MIIVPLLVVVAVFLGILVIAHRSQRSQHISAPMPKGHAQTTFFGRVVPQQPEWIDVVHQRLLNEGLILPTDHDRAEEERRLTVYEKFLEGK